MRGPHEAAHGCGPGWAIVQSLCHTGGILPPLLEDELIHP
jgi:hypothetical protein